MERGLFLGKGNQYRYAPTLGNEHHTMEDTYDLIAEARAKFVELSAAEEKLLRCVQSGDIAYCGPSEKDDDPANDPAKASEWGKERTIRARLVRWLCIDHEASQRIDPRGIQVHAARIGDPPNEDALDLGVATIPFLLSFVRCNFRVPLSITDARIVQLNLRGSCIPGLRADRLTVTGSVFLSDRFRAEGGVRLAGSRIGGDLDCSQGNFENKDGVALDADLINVTGVIYLKDEFTAQGSVSLLGASIGGGLECDGGNFLNNGGYALSADRIKVGASVFLRDNFSSDGELRFPGAEIAGRLDCGGAKFSGTSYLRLDTARVKKGFLWTGIGPDSPVRLNLAHALVGPMADDKESWPKKGNLYLDGFTYERIGAGPTSAEERLEWLARQPEGFIPQPYRQLAKVLRERGDDAGARKVLIAMEDSRLEYGGLSAAQKVVSRILRATVGYGYTPLRALWYIVAFVILGTLLFWWGGIAHVITPVETDPPVARIDPFNPFIYSLENFLPLVDLHMAKYYLPNPNAMPSPLVGPFSDTPFQPAWLGGVLRCYLWLHILLGWFFTSMFIAGITGLVRRE